jgi:hypothetical protein
MAKQPKMTDWSRKKPPMIGEYNASVSRDMFVRRWWNGEYWSSAYWSDYNSEVQQQARRRTKAPERQTSIRWRGLIEKPHYPFPPGPLEKM